MEVYMDNNCDNENNVEKNAKCGKGTKVMFYIMGSFCAVLAIFALLSIGITLFGYDQKVVGTITEINRNRLSERYDVVIEYTIDGDKKTENLYLDTLPLGTRENDKVDVKYSSKNDNVYIPKFESLSEQLTMFLIPAAFAAACFIAPHNSKKAAEKFLSVERHVRR